MIFVEGLGGENIAVPVPAHPKSNEETRIPKARMPILGIRRGGCLGDVIWFPRHDLRILNDLEDSRSTTPRPKRSPLGSQYENSLCSLCLANMDGQAMSIVPIMQQSFVPQQLPQPKDSKIIIRPSLPTFAHPNILDQSRPPTTSSPVPSRRSLL